MRSDHVHGRCAPKQTGCGVVIRSLLDHEACRRALGAPCRLRDPERPGSTARALPSLLSASQLAAAERELPLFRSLLAAPPVHRVNFEAFRTLKGRCGDLCTGMPEGLTQKQGSRPL